MNLPDVYIDRQISDAELVQAVATVLGVRAEDVAIYETYTELSRRKAPSTSVLVERLRVGGEFCQRLGLHGCMEETGLAADGVALLSALCAALATRGVIPDDSSDNPYAFVLLEPGRAPTPVKLDAERLDNGEIVLSSTMSAVHD